MVAGDERLVLEPFSDFESASHAALAYLHEHVPLGLWMVTRVTEESQIVLHSKQAANAYPVKPGDVFRWSDTYCKQMVEGRAPQSAPRVAEIAAYRALAATGELGIGAYVGFPIRTAEGELFGTLCAIDHEPQTDALISKHPALVTMGRLLATVLDRELRIAVEVRRAEHAEYAALRDELTGLPNRRAWELATDTEDARCKRYGHPACVLSIDLDGLKEANDEHGHHAGDELLCKTAQALSLGVREHDVVARLGGDEFGVLLTECPEGQGRLVEARLRKCLADAGVAASIGFARRNPAKDLSIAWSIADAAMYEEKRARRAQR